MSRPADPPPDRVPHWQDSADLLWLAALAARRPDTPSRDTPPARLPPPAPPPEPHPGPPDTPPTAHAQPAPPHLGGGPFGVPAVPDPVGGAEPPQEVAAASAANRRRAVTRAMLAFRRLTASAHGTSELDEEATAERAAEDDLWLPVLTSPLERFLDLDIVIDDSRFALLHRNAATGFAAALTDTAAFRTVRTYLLDTDVKHEYELFLRSGGPGGRVMPASSLARPGAGRRLVVVLTDGVGDAWHTRAAHRKLARWGAAHALVVIHLLPARLWRRTGITPERAVLRNRRPAGPAGGYVHAAPPGPVPVPVIGLDAAQARSWAAFAMAAQPVWRGTVVPCSHDQAEPDPEPPPEDELSAEQRVWRFRMGVSSTAFELAVHLAAAPLNLSVVRLVQRKLVPRATDAHLAEVLGSDLVRRAEPHPVSPSVPYDFVPGVRAELLLAGRRSTTAEVLVTVVDHLSQEVDELKALREVIVSPGRAAVPELSPELSPLVEPTVSALEAMAGSYSAPARDLRDAMSDQLGRSEEPPVGHASNRDLPRPEDSVYTHVVKDLPTPDPFGVTINMTATPVAPKRESHEPTPVWNVPQKNHNFTGREAILNQLHERLSSGTTAVLPEALHGLGGVGKSQIAVEYCYRHQKEYDLIWWIPSERLTMVRQAFVDLADQLDLRVSEPNVAEIAVKEALRLGRPYGNWLLVFDNAEDVEEIKKFFPTNGPGKIMVTSRSRDWFAYATPLEVDVFTRAESRDLLRRRGPDLSDHDADQIADRLGDLPLAIEQAAVWLAETGMPVSEYLELFDAQRNELLDVEGTEKSVAAAWNVSFDRLRTTNPAALQLLQVCAFLAPEPIPRSLLVGSRDLEGPAELLEVLQDPIEISRTTRALNRYALAKVNYRDNTISLHRLVQRVVTSQLSEDERHQLRHCGHLLLANADPKAPNDQSRWPTYHALFPHIFSSHLEECPDPWARGLMLNTIDFLFLWGDRAGYLSMADRVVRAWSEQLGPEHDATLTAELRLGRAKRLFGHFEEAYRHHLHARDALRERLGADHERTLEAQGYLSADLRYLGRFTEAMEIDREAYETLRRRFGPDEPLTLEQAHLLAIDYRLAGDPVRARELDEDTYQRKLELLGPDSRSTISTRLALAIDVMECGEYLAAREMQEEHTHELRSRLQNSHPSTMDAILLLSVMSRKAGRNDEALKLSEEAMSLFKARYGEESQTTVAVVLNHALNLRAIGDLSQAVELGNLAREQYSRIFGPNHPNTPTAAVNIAVALRLMGRVEEARALDRESLDELTRMLGAEHPRTLLCAINYASDLYALGACEEALNLDRQTLERLSRHQGGDHPTTIACMFNLSLDLKAVGQDEEAAVLQSRAMDAYRRVLGDDHPALLSRAQGRRANCDIYPMPV
ncbi:FxSxx-COOH system tetratricopeptide repeat protein [Nonomuraea sp. CA-218870]|uniref:FxSxx-COOH system tetratricopeptide repeat protein n=1 Tax=Nonomuraea sp. CA-218870 TaxID=3239998 RepID=UPI003D8DB130